MQLRAHPAVDAYEKLLPQNESSFIVRKYSILDLAQVMLSKNK